jgi:hypothetical protein
MEARFITIILSSNEVQHRLTLTAVATTPEGAEVALQMPAGVAAELLERQVVLLVGERPASTAPLRIWTEEVRSFRVWLPFVRAGLMKFDNQNH